MSVAPERAAPRAAPLQPGFETTRSTALVIDREDIDVIGPNHEVGPVRKPAHAGTTDATVVDDKDLGLPPEPIKTGADGAQEKISESSPSRLVPDESLVDVALGTLPIA